MFSQVIVATELPTSGNSSALTSTSKNINQHARSSLSCPGTTSHHIDHDTEPGTLDTFVRAPLRTPPHVEGLRDATGDRDAMGKSTRHVVMEVSEQGRGFDPKMVD